MTRQRPAAPAFPGVISRAICTALCAAALAAMLPLSLTAEPQTPAASQSPVSGDFTALPVELSEAGIFCPIENVGTAPAPGTESGYILLMAGDAEVALHSRIVPATLGISFGVNIRLAPDTVPGDFRMVVHHPPFGPRNVTTESWNPNLSAEWGVRSFQFEYPRELQVGTWSFEVHRGDEVLMRQTFEVVPPMQAPEAIDLCFGNTFIS